jgi:hypothetical protein
MTMKPLALWGLVLIGLVSLNACQADPVIELVMTPSTLTWIVGEKTELDISDCTVTLIHESKKTSVVALNAMTDGKPDFSIDHTLDFTLPGTYKVQVTHTSGVIGHFEVIITPKPYIDANPVVVGLYTSSRQLITESFGAFVRNVDIGVYSVFYTQAAMAPKGRVQTVFPQLAEAYGLDEPVKIGYELTFTLKDATVIRQTITGPVDEQSEFWKYVRVYLYDDVHVPINTWYSHLLPSQMTETTLMTSIKLTGNTKTDQIDGSLLLKVFTTDDLEDFDPDTGYYRGQSFYTIQINPKTP